MLSFMLTWLRVSSSSCLCACDERVWDVCFGPIGEERAGVCEGHMYSKAAPVLQMQKNSAEIDREPCVHSPSANTAPHCTRQHACFPWTNTAHWKRLHFEYVCYDADITLFTTPSKIHYYSVSFSYILMMPIKLCLQSTAAFLFPQVAPFFLFLQPITHFTFKLTTRQSNYQCVMVSSCYMVYYVMLKSIKGRA